ncbi:hypothetical protein HAX54_040949 [Datura stramonium]|uniref:Cytochrome P450 n=1 Tax=Datura stramonium TaxID=4076 RepID=A0ABS8VS49_DATST|nr:hypothetical protein [Datura stramonium]
MTSSNKVNGGGRKFMVPQLKISIKSNGPSCRIAGRSSFGKLVPDQDKLIKLVKEVISLWGGFYLADLFPLRKWLHEISGINFKLLKAHTKADVILENMEKKGKMVERVMMSLEVKIWSMFYYGSWRVRNFECQSPIRISKQLFLS